MRETLESEYTEQEPKIAYWGCRDCLCEDCLYRWSGRCPYGECYDDLRAKANPYDKAHPDDPPRTGWSTWESDQAFWCRGGICYSAFDCRRYEKIDDRLTVAKECLCAHVTVYQDKYIRCPIIDKVGCKECYDRFIERRDP